MRKTLLMAGMAGLGVGASAQSFSAAHTYEFDNGGSGAYYDGTQNWLELDNNGISYVGQDFSVSGLTGNISSVTFSETTAGAGLAGPDGSVHGDIYLASPSFDVNANAANINVDCPAKLALENSDGVDKRFLPIFAGTFDVPGATVTKGGSAFSLTLDLTQAGVMSYLDGLEVAGGTLRVIFAGNQSFYPNLQPNGLELRFVGSQNGNYSDPSVTFTTTPTPEPVSTSLLVAGVAGLIVRRCRA